MRIMFGVDGFRKGVFWAVKGTDASVAALILIADLMFNI